MQEGGPPVSCPPVARSALFIWVRHIVLMKFREYWPRFFGASQIAANTYQVCVTLRLWRLIMKLIWINGELKCDGQITAMRRLLALSGGKPLHNVIRSVPKSQDAAGVERLQTPASEQKQPTRAA